MIPRIQKKSPNPSEDPTELLKQQLYSFFQDAQKENAFQNPKNLAKAQKAKEYFNNPAVEAKKEAINKLHWEEQQFLDKISKTNLSEDPLSIWLEYYKWVEKNYPTNEFKKVEVLENLTKSLCSTEKYKKDERYLKKWATYTEFCSDKEEIIKYMEENNIGTDLSIYYKICMVVYEQHRKFSKANSLLLHGKRKKAFPQDKLDTYIKGFEGRMSERLKRDFYSQNKRVTEDDIIEIPVVYNDHDASDSLILSSQESNGAAKRKFPFKESRIQRKKVKLNELVSSQNMGDFNIFVDPDCHEAIPKSTKLVNEYDALCYKYNFSLDPAVQPRAHQSWISKQLSKAAVNVTNTSLNMSSTFIDEKTDIPLVNQFQLPKELRKPLKEREFRVLKTNFEPIGAEQTMIAKSSEPDFQQIKHEPKMLFDDFKDPVTTPSYSLARQDTKDTDDTIDLLDLFGLLNTKKAEKSPKQKKRVSVHDHPDVDDSALRKYKMDIKKTPHPAHKGNIFEMLDDEEEEAEMQKTHQDLEINFLNVFKSNADNFVTPKESRNCSPTKNLNFDNMEYPFERVHLREAEYYLSSRQSLSRDGDDFNFGDKVDTKKKSKKVLGLKNTKQEFSGPARVIPAVYRNERIDNKENGVSDFERYLNNQMSWNELKWGGSRHESPKLNDLLFSKQKGNYLA